MRKKPEPRIEVETFEVPCRIYGCYSKAKYRLGNMSGSPIAFFHLCESCLSSILDSHRELEPMPIENFTPMDLQEEEINDTGAITLVTNIDIDTMDYKQLQQFAKQIGVNATGKMDVLYERVASELGDIDE